MQRAIAKRVSEVESRVVSAKAHVGAPVRQLFEAFRHEVLGVAYKAETNFVDVAPQAKRLRLSLNMEFAEITDPRGLCQDVTDLGRWGNGDVSVGLSSLDELPYVMGLVRQSFEKQMVTVCS